MGHSAKTFFAECRTRQRIALGKEFFVECRTLDKKGHSTKDFFIECQALGKSAGTRHRLPHVTVFGHVLLCRVPAIRHLAKIFFLENTLPSAPDTALGKDSFFFKCLCRVPNSFGTRQREELKKLHFFEIPLPSASKKFKNPLCRAPYSWHSAKTPFAECHAPTLGKFFFASKFFVQPF